MTNLQKQRLELARLRQGGARANRLLAELEVVRRSHSEASREVADYPALEADLLRLEREVSEAREDADRRDRRTRELDLLLRLWKVLERKRAAEQRFATWEQPTPFAAWLEQHATQIQALRSACSGHLERARQLADLCNQRGGIEQSLRAALVSVGPEWDRDRVRAGDGWIALADEGRRFRDRLLEREARWRMARALADEADAAAELAGLSETEALLVADGLGPPASAREAEEQARLLGELRRNLAEQRGLVAQRWATERPVRNPARSLEGMAGTSIALLVVVIVGLALVAVLAPGRPMFRALCGAVAAAAGCALLTIAVSSRRRRVDASIGTDNDEPATISRTAARVVELAASLGLPEMPSESDVETAAERIEEARSRERTREDERRRTVAAISRRRAAYEAVARACDELELERARFGDWKHTQGLGAPLSPDGVLESLSELQTASKDLKALERVDAKIEERRVQITEFESHLESLAAGLRHVGGPAESLEVDPAQGLDDLGASLEGALEMRAVRTSLLRTVEETSAELEGSFGFGAEAVRLRAELEAGEVLAWNEEQEAVAQARSDACLRLELLVRAHQDASTSLRGLAGSARIAELEQQRLALEQELDECLRSWAVLGCARLLLERTLRRHEQERQPAVLARAGERFGKVTEGRYTCLLPSVGDETVRETIRVVSSAGAEMDASSLSRGSVEQLYLCLRLGLAETFAERAVALPFILDDVLVNFDPGRAASIAEALADTADRHQVLFFTCHPHLVKLVLQVAPDAQVVELERI